MRIAHSITRGGVVKMNLAQKVILLTTLSELQESTAQITLKIGSVTPGNQVDNISITILDGPPAVFSSLVTYQEDQRQIGNTIYIEPGHGGIRVW